MFLFLLFLSFINLPYLFIGENRFTIETFMKTGPLAMLSIFERLTGSDQPFYAQVGFCAEWLLDNICKILIYCLYLF